jgi:hypothetical protein
VESAGAGTRPDVDDPARPGQRLVYQGSRTGVGPADVPVSDPDAVVRRRQPGRPRGRSGHEPDLTSRAKMKSRLEERGAAAAHPRVILERRAGYVTFADSIRGPQQAENGSAEAALHLVRVRCVSARWGGLSAAILALADLPHQRIHIGVIPHFDDLALFQAIKRELGNSHLPTGRLDSLEDSPMGAGDRKSHRDIGTVDNDVPDIPMPVRERREDGCELGQGGWRIHSDAVDLDRRRVE